MAATALVNLKFFISAVRVLLNEPVKSDTSVDTERTTNEQILIATKIVLWAAYQSKSSDFADLADDIGFNPNQKKIEELIGDLVLPETAEEPGPLMPMHVGALQKITIEVFSYLQTRQQSISRSAEALQTTLLRQANDGR